MDINNPEIKKSSERPSQRKATKEPWESELTIELAEQISDARQQDLEDIRSFVSLPFYNRLSEKLAEERQEFRALLDIDDARKKFLSQYSLVLNPSFFEQKLFPIKWKT